jgi:hypothetical protein
MVGRSKPKSVELSGGIATPIGGFVFGVQFGKGGITLFAGPAFGVAAGGSAQLSWTKINHGRYGSTQACVDIVCISVNKQSKVSIGIGAPYSWGVQYEMRHHWDR